MSLQSAVTRCVVAALAAEVVAKFPNITTGVAPVAQRVEVLASVDACIDKTAVAKDNNDIGMSARHVLGMAQELAPDNQDADDDALARKALREDENAQTQITELAHRLATRLDLQLTILRHRDRLPQQAQALADKVQQFIPVVQKKVLQQAEPRVVTGGRLNETAYRLAMRYHLREVANIPDSGALESYRLPTVMLRISGDIADIDLSDTQKAVLTRHLSDDVVSIVTSPVRYQAITIRMRTSLVDDQANYADVGQLLAQADDLSRAAEQLLTITDDGLPIPELRKIGQVMRSDMWLAHGALETLFQTRYKDVVFLPGGTPTQVPVLKTGLDALQQRGFSLQDVMMVNRYVRHHRINFNMATVDDVAAIIDRAKAEMSMLDELDRQREASSQHAVSVEALTHTLDLDHDRATAGRVFSNREEHLRQRNIVAAQVTQSTPTVDLMMNYLVGMVNSNQLTELYNDMRMRLTAAVGTAQDGIIKSADLNRVLCRTVAEAVCRHVQRTALV